MKILGLRNTIIASALALIVGSCINPPKDRAEKHNTFWLPGGGLEMVQPADIAVMPFKLRTKDTEIPSGELREQLYRGLLDRLYTPLPFSWVDTGGESDAELQVTMLRWDRKDLSARGAVLARAEARMVKGADVLWAVEVTREVSANSFGGDARTDVGVAEMRCAEVFAGEILALLPVRDAMAAQ